MKEISSVVHILGKCQEEWVPVLGIDTFARYMKWVAIGKHCLFDAFKLYYMIML